MQLEIEFFDPAEVPVPPEEVEFRSLEAEPYPDGARVKVSMTLTPFQERPSIDIEVLDPQGAKVASSSIVEATDTTMSLTLHLKSPGAVSNYTLIARIHYEDLGEVARGEASFSISQAD